MTRFSTLTSAFLFAGFAVMGSAAQTAATPLAAPGPQTAKLQAIIAAPPNAACPVAMTAQHGMDGNTVAVNGTDHRGLGQQIELMLNNSGSRVIASLRIRVNGWNGTGHALPTESSALNHLHSSRTFAWNVPLAPGKSAKMDLWVGGLSSVNSIDLLEVRYAKGLNWRASDAQTCRIVPEAATLISLR